MSGGSACVCICVCVRIKCLLALTLCDSSDEVNTGPNLKLPSIVTGVVLLFLFKVHVFSSNLHSHTMSCSETKQLAQVDV